MGTALSDTEAWVELVNRSNRLGEEFTVEGELNGVTTQVISALTWLGNTSFAAPTGHKTGRFYPASQWKNIRKV
jgi:hypothetical protein